MPRCGSGEVIGAAPFSASRDGDGEHAPDGDGAKYIVGVEAVVDGGRHVEAG